MSYLDSDSRQIRPFQSRAVIGAAGAPKCPLNKGVFRNTRFGLIQPTADDDVGPRRALSRASTSNKRRGPWAVETANAELVSGTLISGKMTANALLRVIRLEDKAPFIFGL